MARDDRFDDLGNDDGPDWDPTDLDYDEDDGDWTDEDEARYQARRREELKRSNRTRRQAISFLVLVLLVMGAGVGAAGIAQGWWEWPIKDSGSAERPICGAPTLVAALPADTTVVVLNATDVRGLATAIGEALAARGFKVSDVGNEDDAIEVLDSVHIRHGPESLMQAKAVAAQFRSPVLVDDGRTERAIELSIGHGYRRMVDAETAAAAIAPVPGPSVAGCIPASTPAATTTEPAPTTTPVPTP